MKKRALRAIGQAAAKLPEMTYIAWPIRKVFKEVEVERMVSSIMGGNRIEKIKEPRWVLEKTPVEHRVNHARRLKRAFVRGGIEGGKRYVQFGFSIVQKPNFIKK